MYGIDILEEIVYFLDIMIFFKILIIIIGVMRSINEFGSDGVYNYLLVFCVVNSIKVVDKGVLVVMNDEIYVVKYVIKIYIINVLIF